MKTIDSQQKTEIKAFRDLNQHLSSHHQSHNYLIVKNKNVSSHCIVLFNEAGSFHNTLTGLHGVDIPASIWKEQPIIRQQFSIVLLWPVKATIICMQRICYFNFWKAMMN